MDSYAPGNVERKKAEAALKEASHKRGYASTLLQISRGKSSGPSGGDVDMGHAAAI